MFKAISSVFKKTKEIVDDVVSSTSIDDEKYAIAEREIEYGLVNEGLWAKALVIAKGDEQRRKAEYIKLRAKRLAEAENQQQSMRIPMVSSQYKLKLNL